MIFLYLVKLFDKVNHQLMIRILELYGGLPKLRSAIAMIYEGLKVVLKIDKVEKSMGQTVIVGQGDFMVPVLYLFMVIVFSETLKKEWVRELLIMVPLEQQTYSSFDIGKFTDHKCKTFS